jgi:hypothetical protein
LSSEPFAALRLISSVIRVLAWIALGVGVIGSLALMGRTGDAGAGALLLGFEALIGSVIVFVLVLAVAECIGVVLAIERNTRASSDLVDHEARA